MLPKCLFFVCWTPFVGCNMWSFTVGTFWLFFLFIWASFMMMALRKLQIRITTQQILGRKYLVIPIFRTGKPFFFRESVCMMALPTDKAFGFRPTSFGRMSETLAVPALLYGNCCPKFFHPINNTCYWTG